MTNPQIVSLAILGDDDINWRPDHFVLQAGGTTVRFDFPIVKLLDYREKWSELETDRNPFATVVMVHLRTLETTSNRRARKEFKLSLMKRLYEQGFERQDIINLYELIDWVMTLPEELQAEFNQQITQYEEEMKMPYITSIERSGELRGKLKGKQDILLQILNYRFSEIEPSLVEQIKALSREQLAELAKAVFNFSTATDLRQWLQNRPKPVEES